MPKAIFLDVDGVIAIPPAFLKTDLILNLGRAAILTNAKIVVSSSWRLCAPYLVRLKSRLEEIGLSVIGCTPYLKEGLLDRHLEILKYLEEHPEIEHFVAVDDLPLSLPPANFVHTNMDKGLDEEKTEELILKMQAK